MTTSHESGPPRTLNAKQYPCRCVAEHRPPVKRTVRHHIHPLGMGGPEAESNIRVLCPTTHSDVHLIIEDFVRNKGERPRKEGETRYAYALAIQGWNAYLAYLFTQPPAPGVMAGARIGERPDGVTAP